ncbi:MAG: serine/threonine protein kinase [Kiritimatiellia bacterium]|jgi:eukaryotic-like serine/threonine-protein kinase
MNNDDTREFAHEPEVRLDDSTKTDLHQTMTADIEQAAGIGRQPLVDNYKALIQERAIYYPVAYTFENELGRGRQGSVFVGLRQGARGCLTRHAIKVFDPGIYSNAKKYWTDMGRVASQVSTLHRLRSPNLVAMDSYDEVNGIGYVQMEVINGLDLRQVLRGTYHQGVKSLCTDSEWREITTGIFRPLDTGGHAIQPGIAIYIMRMILKGLETLHEAGFIHSDIKPANVMIDRFGYVKLIDYGRAARPREKSTILFGSPLYMAPEVHRRDQISERADLYSTGMVGLELMAGRPVVDHGDFSEPELLKMKEVLPTQIESFLPPSVRENAYLVGVMRRMLDPQPLSRHEDAVSAESGSHGLRTVHTQLTKIGQDADYTRLMGLYMAKAILVREASFV